MKKMGKEVVKKIIRVANGTGCYKCLTEAQKEMEISFIIIKEVL